MMNLRVSKLAGLGLALGLAFSCSVALSQDNVAVFPVNGDGNYITHQWDSATHSNAAIYVRPKREINHLAQIYPPIQPLPNGSVGNNAIYAYPGQKEAGSAGGPPIPVDNSSSAWPGDTGGTDVISTQDALIGTLQNHVGQSAATHPWHTGPGSKSMLDAVTRPHMDF